jgi:hypothetical protein
MFSNLLVFRDNSSHKSQKCFYKLARFFVSLGRMKKFKTRLSFFFTLLMAVYAHGQQNAAFSFDRLFEKHAAIFDPVIKHKADYRLQIIYTRVDRDKNNVPHLTTYTFDANKYYYYCASLIKLPASVLTLEKLNNLSKYRVNMMDSLGIDSIACGDLNPMNMMLGTAHSYLGQYIKEMLMISNNNAFNPVYDFLGQQYFQDRLRQLGYKSAVISNRFAGCDTTQNRFCDAVSLYDRHTHDLKYSQPCTINKRRQYYAGPLNPEVGTGYLTDNNQLVKKPKDFRYANYMALSDFHKLLTTIVFPQLQPASQKLNLTKRDYQYLYKCMGMFPRESETPKLDPAKYPDQYMNYFMGPDSGASVMPAGTRTFNKVGQAYGFMTDCSYIVDTVHKVEFFLSCSMYLNADGILNDGVYEYDKIGYPFFHELYKAIYADEVTRQKRYKPTVHMPEFKDAPPYNPQKAIALNIDSTKSMSHVELQLCRLADSMWADRRLYINYDDPGADEIFLNNLSAALRMRASIGYAFSNLKKKRISIIRSGDKHLTVFSWDKDSPFSNYTLLQFSDSLGRIEVEKPKDFKGNETLPKLIYTKADYLRTPSGTIYLLKGQTSATAGSAEYLQAYGLLNGKTEKLKIFSSGKDMYSDLLVEKYNNNGHIVYDPKRKTIIYPLITKSQGKVIVKQVKLKFDGHVFK